MGRYDSLRGCNLQIVHHGVLGKKIARLQISLHGLRGVLGKKIARLQIGLRGVGEEDRGQGFGKKPTDNN